MQRPTAVHARQLLTARSDAGIVVVKRDGGTTNGVACTHRLWLDGQPLADLEAREGLTFYVPPGEHVLSLKMGGGLCGNAVPEVAFAVAAGQRKVFRSGVQVGGAPVLQATAF